MVTTEKVYTQDEVVTFAAELLSRRYGGVPEFTQVTDLGGSGNALVLRARMTPTAFLPHRSVVIKYNPMTGHSIDDAALLLEVVAYQFTTALNEDVRPGPVLFAADLERRILVLSDAGEGDTLADVLTRAKGEDRKEVLRKLGRSLGQMHAGTAGRELDYETLLNRMLRQHPEYEEHQALRDESLRASILIGADTLSKAGLPAPAHFVELAEKAASALSYGQERAFTPFDLSPDNVIVSQRLSFLDYEWAGYRNVGFDVACVIAGFPQFLFARPISDEEAEIFISAWQRHVTGVWPRFADDAELHELIVASLIGWALSSVTTMYAGGIEGVVALAEGSAEVFHDARNSLLRPADQGPFSEEEVLIRRDLYETFEALSRYAAQCGSDTCQPVAEFGRTVATRLRGA
ncbi:phosphotransferase [Corynebacterium striatum]|uniref:phosphotransferase n=1 Tax=Corynebacterium striatum TaxID=43770 RepID=UPI000C1CC57A|nr:phosphotransferase [Corynebacterium striatum]MBD0856633.1 phosphotransferase [Corynebacterium striatum]PIS63075.1 phosphotransferase [Corynebacterium striatum]PIS63209.1 phosphotransferase [Corynebacterium striatum]PIS66944.1 phosphotransferase [Corynebacterium striatum]PXY08012.1 phosphotransferase [Corynebacterium striatum]